jgi:hypothetical protein
VDIGNLGWAIERAGGAIPAAVRVLVVGAEPESSRIAAVLTALRAAGVACARGPSTDVRDYAEAWRYSFVLEMRPADASLTRVGEASARILPGGTPDTVAKATLAALVAAPEKL